MKTTDPPIIVEQTFDKSREQVWDAITDLEKMKLWFFENIPYFKPQVGFKTEFNVTSENRNFHHLWEIIEVIPNTKIVYHWSYSGYKGESYVTFELIEQNKKTQVKLTTKITEDFPDDIPEFKWESCQNGWNYFIKDSLVNYLKN